MRFRYFDASGTEVEVSSVDALAFRIRTGAIGPETLLYDAAVGEWGPAGEHPAFRFVMEERGEGASDAEGAHAEDGDAYAAEADASPDGSDPAAGPPTTPRSKPAASEAFGPSESGEETGAVESAGHRVRDIELPGPLLADRPRNPSGRSIRAGRRGGRRLRWGTVVAGSAVLFALSLGILLGRATDETAGEVAETVSAAAVSAPAPSASEGVEELSAAASGDLAVALLDLQSALEVPDQPPEIWLEGSYLANAATYPEVAEYWERFGGSISVVRSLEGRLYRGFVNDHLARTGLEGDARDALSARVLDRFEAGAEKRQVLYDDLERLAAEAVALHELLVEESDAVDYAPFTSDGLSRDPVLEAVPDDPALSAAIWGHMDRIFEILERLQGIGPVTTPRLSEALLQGIRPPGR